MVSPPIGFLPERDDNTLRFLAFFLFFDRSADSEDALTQTHAVRIETEDTKKEFIIRASSIFNATHLQNR